MVTYLYLPLEIAPTNDEPFLCSWLIMAYASSGVIRTSTALSPGLWVEVVPFRLPITVSSEPATARLVSRMIAPWSAAMKRRLPSGFSDICAIPASGRLFLAVSGGWNTSGREIWWIRVGENVLVSRMPMVPFPNWTDPSALRPVSETKAHSVRQRLCWAGKHILFSMAFRELLSRQCEHDLVFSVVVPPLDKWEVRLQEQLRLWK